MTSSSCCEGYCELVLRLDGAEVFHLPLVTPQFPRRSPKNPRFPANRSIELTLRRGSGRSLLRVLLENEELMRLPPERNEWTLQLGEKLRDQYGLADLVVEESRGRDGRGWSLLLSVTMTLEADPTFQRLHEALVAELEEVHEALTHDVVSATWHRPEGPGSARTVRVASDQHQLDGVYERLESALQTISEQPTRALHLERRLGRWRPGDTVSAAALHRLAHDGDVRRDRSGRLVVPRKMLLDRPKLVTDIEEHRHIRAGLLRLGDRCLSLSHYCDRAICLLEEEEGRWSEDALRQKIHPKIDALASIREQAKELQSRFRLLVDRFPFIAEASSPRTSFGPTPLFLGRPAYRAIYRALLESRRQARRPYESDALRIRFRNLATLYEYWVFVKVVGLLREMHGAPAGDRDFALIDEFYRPELAPGQQFRFHLSQGDVLVATYEPDFPPVGWQTRERYRAAFVSAPLRPDVTLELHVAGRPPAILALDAKSGPRFRKVQERLQGASAYLWQIHDPQSGHQPVRQLFLVHRDLDVAPVTNVAGYLDGRCSPQDSRVLGAVPAQPGRTAHLENVILRFLETYRARRWK